jgi:bacterioferritin (cytochrome b1)
MANERIERSIRQLNSLLRGEISAAETYRMAIEKIGPEHTSEATQLRASAQEHGESAQLLRDQVRRLGGEADNSSGTWGIYAEAIQGAANLFGDDSALKALKEGEEHGLKGYREAIDDLDEISRELVIEQLIPAQGRHIGTLEGMLRDFSTRSARGAKRSRGKLTGRERERTRSRRSESFR